MSGGSATNTYGYYYLSSGTLNIVGNGSAGSAINAHGLFIGSGNTPTVVLTGNCTGSNSSAANGCAIESGAMTFSGNSISGLKGGGLGTVGAGVTYTPANTGYILYPKDSSYTLGTINSHSTLMPTDPGSTNVRTGTVYGPNTGSYGGGGGSTIATCGGW
jgi:hypothetical protein